MKLGGSGSRAVRGLRKPFILVDSNDLVIGWFEPDLVFRAWNATIFPYGRTTFV